MVDAPQLGILFFGTPAFAVPTLEELLATQRVVGIITQPDRPRGRGQRLGVSPVKVGALAAGYAPLQPETLNDPQFLTTLADLRPDLGVVAAYGRILPQSVIDVPRLGTINVHASLLPRYRGAAPVHRAIMAGDVETGVTIMRLVKALDAGPMIAVRRRVIGPDETSAEVEGDLARLGARLLISTLGEVASGTAREEPQDERQATYAPRLTKADGRINWSWSAQAIHNQIRGLHPWPLASAFCGPQRLILRRSRPSPSETRLTPGTIVAADTADLAIATGDGTLHVLELQVEGGRPMAAREFLAGHHLRPGEVLRSAP